MENKKATFEHSVDVLVKAYLNDTLEHMECHACAVGNLVADALNVKIMKDKYGCIWEVGKMPYWYDVIGLGSVNHGHRNILKAQREADATGYSLEELAKIEHAFENASDPNGSRDGFDELWMFNGLLAVVDVLAEIHNVDLSVKEQAVGRLTEIHATK